MKLEVHNKVALKRAQNSCNLSLWGYMKKEKLLYIMMIPVILYFIVFCYGPMFGIIIAFQKYSPFKGFLNSEWVGLKNFQILFGSPDFTMILKNTLLINAYRLVIGFPAPIILALMLNEVRNKTYKKITQTISYLPHFLSWVIVSGIITTMLSLNGPVNSVLSSLGIESQQFLLKPDYFRGILVITGIWKEIGWGTLLYLAAISSVDTQLYESAIIDGAGRFKQTLHITLPSIKGVMVVLLIFAVGGILNTGFEQVLLLQNSMVRNVSEIIDTYVYKVGIKNANYSFATAVGLFKSLIGVVLITGTNYVAKMVDENSLW